MSIAQQLLAEFEAQAPVTKTFLERLPEQHFLWKPHARSMTAGQLAYHLATVPGGTVRMAQQEQVPLPDFVFPQPDSAAEILSAFAESVSVVRELLPSFDDEAMKRPWRVVAANQAVLVEMTKQELLRSILLNHWYQHRGQFSVYLRLLDVPVPSSWGPSADER